MAFKEAMRLIPPVISLPRRALRDFEFAGYRLPAGTRVNTSIIFTHHMAEHWPEPERFDPRAFPRRIPAAAIASPSRPSAAARICAWGCTSPTCRRSASPIIS